MNHHVMKKRLSRGELLVAHRADEELFSGVEPAMLGQVPLPLETLAAVIALECGCLSALHLNLRTEQFELL